MKVSNVSKKSKKRFWLINKKSLILKLFIANILKDITSFLCIHCDLEFRPRIPFVGKLTNLIFKKRILKTWLLKYSKYFKNTKISLNLKIFPFDLLIDYYSMLTILVLFYAFTLGYHVLYFGLRPGQKCHSKVMHRKEVTHSNCSYERKSRGRKLADEMGRGRKIPMVLS